MGGAGPLPAAPNRAPNRGAAESAQKQPPRSSFGEHLKDAMGAAAGKRRDAAGQDAATPTGPSTGPGRSRGASETDLPGTPGAAGDSGLPAGTGPALAVATAMPGTAVTALPGVQAAKPSASPVETTLGGVGGVSTAGSAGTAPALTAPALTAPALTAPGAATATGGAAAQAVIPAVKAPGPAAVPPAVVAATQAAVPPATDPAAAVAGSTSTDLASAGTAPASVASNTPAPNGVGPDAVASGDPSAEGTAQAAGAGSPAPGAHASGSAAGDFGQPSAGAQLAPGVTAAAAAAATGPATAPSAAGAVPAPSAAGTAAASGLASGGASGAAVGAAQQGGAAGKVNPADGRQSGNQPGSLPAVSDGGLPAALPVTPLAPATPAAPAAHQPAPPALAEQLSRPIFQLATGQVGTRVMTVQVVPDSLGPVTVSARMGADGVRIELLAATDAGRDGLRLILTELRRDLASQGVQSSLSLSSSLNGGAGAEGQAQSFGQGGSPRGADPGPPGSGAARPREHPAAGLRDELKPLLTTTSLDITV